MLLWYLLMVPVPLQSWPHQQPPTTQPHQLETQTKTRFRNTEVFLLLLCSALHKAYQTQRWEARFLRQLAQKWFCPLSLRTELVSESRGPGAWIPSRASPGWPGAGSRRGYSAAISVSPSGCAADHEGGRQNIWGVSILPRALKEKVNSH